MTLPPYVPVHEDPRQIMYEDRSLPHQIVIRTDAQHNGAITVGCNCTGSVPIAARPRWEPGEALATWREYHRERTG